jgi:hypothetical protein
VSQYNLFWGKVVKRFSEYLHIDPLHPIPGQSGQAPLQLQGLKPSPQFGHGAGQQGQEQVDGDGVVTHGLADGMAQIVQRKNGLGVGAAMSTSGMCGHGQQGCLSLRLNGGQDIGHVFNQGGALAQQRMAPA